MSSQIVRSPNALLKNSHSVMHKITPCLRGADYLSGKAAAWFPAAGEFAGPKAGNAVILIPAGAIAT
jgi:hypothetical protein